MTYVIKNREKSSLRSSTQKAHEIVKKWPEWKRNSLGTRSDVLSEKKEKK